jgi:hypothetical protein
VDTSRLHYLTSICFDVWKPISRLSLLLFLTDGIEKVLRSSPLTLEEIIIRPLNEWENLFTSLDHALDKFGFGYVHDGTDGVSRTYRRRVEEEGRSLFDTGSSFFSGD